MFSRILRSVHPRLLSLGALLPRRLGAFFRRGRASGRPRDNAILNPQSSILAPPLTRPTDGPRSRKDATPNEHPGCSPRPALGLHIQPRTSPPARPFQYAPAFIAVGTLQDGLRELADDNRQGAKAQDVGPVSNRSTLTPSCLRSEPPVVLTGPGGDFTHAWPAESNHRDTETRRVNSNV